MGVVGWIVICGKSQIPNAEKQLTEHWRRQKGKFYLLVYLFGGNFYLLVDNMSAQISIVKAYLERGDFVKRVQQLQIQKFKRSQSAERVLSVML